jgi:hypothetical protein
VTCSRSEASSRESAGSISASSVPVCELCGSASRTRSVSGSSGSIGPEFRSTRTCAPLWPTATVNGNYNRAGLSPTSGDGLATAVAKAQGGWCPCRCHTSMSSAAASPARTSQSPAEAEGIGGARSGLWGEYARLIRDLRPRYVVVENVRALVHRGLGRVLGDLADAGYDSEWRCIRASDVGAPHQRDRIWIVAYPMGHADRPGLQGHGRHDERPGERAAGPSGAQPLGDADVERRDGRAGQLGAGWRGEPSDAGWWLSEPDVGRVAHGVPARVDRLRSLGNALVPQIAEWIGGRIIEWEHDRMSAAA